MSRERPDTGSEALRALALRYLSRYAVSTQGLKDYLMRKIRQMEAKAARDNPAYERLDPDVLNARVAQVAEHMKGVQLINDKAYGEARVASLRGKGFSRRRIEADLARKGLRNEELGETLEALDPLEQARLFARRKRLLPQAGETPERAAKRREKGLAALLRQGFSFHIARQVMAEAPVNETDEEPSS